MNVTAQARKKAARKPLIRQGRTRRESGMTLVELMISLVISSLVVFFLFSIQVQMSRAFQAQSAVSEVSQNLETAKQLLVTEARMAGFGLATSGTVAVAPGVDVSQNIRGFSVNNNAAGDGVDSIRVLYADPIGQVLVTAMGPVFVTTASPPPAFADNEPIVISSPSAACLVAVTNTNPNQIHFNPNKGGLPYNDAPQNRHCDPVRLAFAAGEPVTIQRFVSHSYRIDPSRPDIGYLQMSPSGEVVANDWIDLGIGFTNLQIASRYVEPGDLVDADGDGDPERDWYSSDNQKPVDPSGVRPAAAILVEVNIGIEGRSPLGTRGAAASLRTPGFVDLANAWHNSVGDWGQTCSGISTPCGIDLQNTADGDRPERYVGDFIYRSLRSRVDLRNMGIGR